jgi:hypothetical protein
VVLCTFGLGFIYDWLQELEKPLSWEGTVKIATEGLIEAVERNSF